MCDKFLSIPAFEFNSIFQSLMFGCSEIIEIVVIAMFVPSVMISFCGIFFWKDLISSNEMSSNPRNYGRINGILCRIQAVGYNLGTRDVIREEGSRDLNTANREVLVVRKVWS